MRVFVVIAPLVLFAAHAAQGHEFRPAFLQVDESTGDEYVIRWKAPPAGVVDGELRPVFPDHCRPVGVPLRSMEGGAVVESWRIACDHPLGGESLGIAGLDASRADALIRMRMLDGQSRLARASAEDSAVKLGSTGNSWRTARTYLELGVEHILEGVDHLLFVLALLLIVGRGPGGGRRLLGTITAFTVAHSLTLAAATLGIARAPQQPVEAVIALSILFVAAEIAHGRSGRPGLTARAPWIVAFAFGLLHGFGFAGALAEIGLPPDAVPLALLLFNVGVEVGQLLFVGVLLAFGVVGRRLGLSQRLAALAGAPAYGIGALAAFWTIERVVGFWG